MARLTAAARRGLRSSTFAVPGRRAFPIPDKSHARAALRLIGHAHSAAEKTAIRKKANAMLGRRMKNGGAVGLRGTKARC